MNYAFLKWIGNELHIKSSFFNQNFRTPQTFTSSFLIDLIIGIYPLPYCWFFEQASPGLSLIDWELKENRDFSVDCLDTNLVGCLLPLSLVVKWLCCGHFIKGLRMGMDTKGPIWLGKDVISCYRFMVKEGNFFFF
jgi:hypothetical protein